MTWPYMILKCFEDPAKHIYKYTHATVAIISQLNHSSILKESQNT